MRILSHRGYWKITEEKNQMIAFERSFDLGFGTETDLRDVCGKIVISHDMPNGNEITFEEILKIMDGRNLPLALNIKADGQTNEIKRLLEKYNHTNYFTFDMSIPDLVVQIESGLNAFAGISDINTGSLLDKVNGVWLDNFNGEWYGPDYVKNLINNNKKVCLVSSDLHKRNVDWQWKMIKDSGLYQEENLLICTDKPEVCKKYFFD